VILCQEFVRDVKSERSGRAGLSVSHAIPSGCTNGGRRTEISTVRREDVGVSGKEKKFSGTTATSVFAAVKTRQSFFHLTISTTTAIRSGEAMEVKLGNAPFSEDYPTTIKSFATTATTQRLSTGNVPM
jgi:hypothetical protein